MHQEHTIPWNKLASNYRFIRDNPHFTPRVTGLWLRQRPSQQQDLDYFKRVLAQTIRTFADTERKKYDAVPKLPAGGLPLYDELRERSGIYAEAIQVLLVENELLPLLVLDRNPIHYLRMHGSHGWSCGIWEFMQWSLLAYILINLSTAMGVLDDGRYLETAVYKKLLGEKGFDLWFWKRNDDYSGFGRIFKQYVGPAERDPVWNRPMLHKDYPRLREYMKTCFALLYRFDVVMRECGVGLDWEEEIGTVLHRLGRGR